MTLPLRRKRPITARGRSTPIRTICEAAGLALLLLAIHPVQAQQYSGSAAYPAWNIQPAPLPVTPRPVAAPSIQLPPVGAPAALPGTLQRTNYQPPMNPRITSDDTQDANLSLEPPGPEKLHKLESEQSLFERLRQEAMERKPAERISFPEEPVLSRDAYMGRAWPQRSLFIEPNYVNYDRLMFEEVNSERYGWDLGVFGTLVSTVAFYKDVALYPYHRFTDPLRREDSNAGYCLPGDPVPYKLYPPVLSATGAVAEAGAILVLLAVFP